MASISIIAAPVFDRVRVLADGSFLAVRQTYSLSPVSLRKRKDVAGTISVPFWNAYVTGMASQFSES